MTVSSATSTTFRQGAMTSPRNLINAGVFSALYFFALFATGMLGFLHPLMMFASWILGLAVCAVICMLYVSRTRAFGAYTILGLVIGILMLVTGHAWVTPLVSTGLGLLADAITRSGGYTRTSTNALGFAVFSEWIVAPLLPVVWSTEEYLADMSQSMGQDFAQDFGALVTLPFLLVWAAAIVIIAYGCALLGMRVLRRHFQRAGVA